MTSTTLRRISLGCAAAVVGAAGYAAYPRAQPRDAGAPSTATAPGSPGAMPEAALPAGPSAPAPPPSPPEAGRATAAPPAPRVAASAAGPSMSEDGAPREGAVRVRAGQVLAVVNGTSLTLADLVPLERDAAGAERAMSPEMYAFLLERAIDRELTLQEARAQGVELDAEQRRNLADMRRRAEAREPGAFDELGRGAASTEFEQRDFAALMLQSALAVRSGAPRPHVTAADVSRYFEEHRPEFGALPRDAAERRDTWMRIEAEIRAKLSGAVGAEHQRGVRELLERLRARATIDVGRPPA